MKGLILSISFLFLFNCSTNSSDSFLYNEFEKVYICKGHYSKSYHHDPECEGLRTCTTEIFEVTLESAEKKGRILCGYEQ